MATHALYPGRFDPFTLGHLDVVRRACRLFEKVSVAVLDQPASAGRFETNERLALIRAAVSDLDEARRIEVVAFRGLAVEFMRARGASLIVRGLRHHADLATEFSMAAANRALSAGFETVFLSTSGDYAHISSSLVREVIRYGGPIDAFVPPQVARKIQAMKTSAD